MTRTPFAGADSWERLQTPRDAGRRTFKEAWAIYGYIIGDPPNR